MKQLIDDISNKNKSIEKKLKIFGLDSIKINENVVEQSSIENFKQEIEYSDMRNQVSSMEKNIKKLIKDIEKHKNLIASLNECLGGRVNVSEIKQAAVKHEMHLKELKNAQIDNDGTVQNIILKLKELEQ